MAIRITKDFQPLSLDRVNALAAHMGVFELADDDDRVVFVGYAGGRSLFGLRGELLAWLDHAEATQFRTEVTTAYLTRYQELLMAHRADTGQLPSLNDPAIAASLGRLSPLQG